MKERGNNYIKRSILLLISLLSLCTLASCNQETKIEYIDRIVEVEKPVEVIKEVEVVKEVEVPVEVEKTVYVEKPIEVEKIVEKEVTVEVPVEKIVEVEKPVYVERSQVNLNGLDAVKIDNNLYEFEFTAEQCYSNTSYSLPVTKMFDLNGVYIAQDYSSSTQVFRRGELVSKPGYIIKDILFANPRKMGRPDVLDNNYNSILPTNTITDRTIAAIKFEYTNINKEQIHISFNHTESGMKEFYGPEVIRIIFSVRK